MRNGEVSFWYSTIDPVRRRSPLGGDLDADIAIVGGGLTGLWSAYYLTKALPDARIVVLEKEFCGFGASGRNGGWLSAEVPGNRSHYADIAEHQGVGVQTVKSRLNRGRTQLAQYLRAHTTVDS